MFNIKTNNLIFKIYENSVLKQEGVIPVLLVPHLISSIDFTAYSIKFTQLQDESATVYGVTDETNFIADDEHRSVRSYDAIQASKELYETGLLDSSSYEEIQRLIDEQLSMSDTDRLANMVIQSQQFYEESLAAQEQLRQAQEQREQEEALRLDLLRVQTVTSVATNPMSAVDALMSEVGTNGDVQRQIAMCMTNDKEITKLVVASTASLWNDSFTLMEVISIQALEDSEICDLVITQLPQDSLLYQNLQSLRVVN